MHLCAETLSLTLSHTHTHIHTHPCYHAVSEKLRAPVYDACRGERLEVKKKKKRGSEMSSVCRRHVLDSYDVTD